MAGPERQRHGRSSPFPSVWHHLRLQLPAADIRHDMEALQAAVGAEEAAGMPLSLQLVDQPDMPPAPLQESWFEPPDEGSHSRPPPADQRTALSWPPTPPRRTGTSAASERPQRSSRRPARFAEEEVTQGEDSRDTDRGRGRDRDRGRWGAAAGAGGTAGAGTGAAMAAAGAATVAGGGRSSRAGAVTPATGSRPASRLPRSRPASRQAESYTKVPVQPAPDWHPVQRLAFPTGPQLPPQPPTHAAAQAVPAFGSRAATPVGPAERAAPATAPAPPLFPQRQFPWHPPPPPAAAPAAAPAVAPAYQQPLYDWQQRSSVPPLPRRPHCSMRAAGAGSTLPAALQDGLLDAAPGHAASIPYSHHQHQHQHQHQQHQYQHQQHQRQQQLGHGDPLPGVLPAGAEETAGAGGARAGTSQPPHVSVAQVRQGWEHLHAILMALPSAMAVDHPS